MCDLHDHHGLPPLEADEYVLDTPFVRELVAAVRETIDAASRRRGLRARSGRSSSRRCTRARLAPGGVQARRARQRHGRRHRPVAALPLGRPLALPVQPRRAAGLDDADPRPPRVGARRALPGNQDEEFYEPREGGIELTRRRPLAARRLLRAASAGRRRPPRAHDLGRDVRLDPPARERHRLHRAPHLRHETGAARPFRSGYANADCEARPPAEPDESSADRVSVSARMPRPDARGRDAARARRYAEARW